MYHLFRFTTMGAPDTLDIASLFQGSPSTGEGMVINSSGDFILCGTQQNEIGAARYTSAGNVIFQKTSGGSEGGHAVTFDPISAYILTAGEQSGDFRIRRYTVTGGQSGVQRIDFYGGDDAALAITTYPASSANFAGRIVAVGNVESQTQGENIGVVRIISPANGGAMDGTFDSDGKLDIDLFGGNEKATGVAVQTDDKIVVSARVVNGPTTYLAVLRFNSNGTLDTSFDGDGYVLVNCNSCASAGNVSIQADGRIVAVGTSGNGSAADFLVVRIWP